MPQYQVTYVFTKLKVHYEEIKAPQSKYACQKYQPIQCLKFYMPAHNNLQGQSIPNLVLLYNVLIQITEAMLCAGGQLNKDGCQVKPDLKKWLITFYVSQGDSGGPLTVDDNGKHVLIGDVSFGNKCGLEGQYGVYGDVAFFKTWIDTNVGENGGAKICPA